MKKKVTIIGGGTAGLFFASFLNSDLYDVTIYEKKSSLGRKFLVAGDGGLNLTHSEDLSILKTKYTPPYFLDNALNCFSNIDLRSWLSSIGVPTFIGSSGRVFPEKGIKPIQVLKSIESYLIDKKIKFEFNKTFTAWGKENSLILNNKETIKSDYTVFSMGGASWKVTGSNGSWLTLFAKKGVDTMPFKPSNCAYKIAWNKLFIQRNEGKPLKNISISMDGRVQKGEAVVTKFGIEGNAIYALSLEIQMALLKNKAAVVYVDFKPTFSLSTLIEKMTLSTSNTTKTLSEHLKLSRTVVELIKVTLTKEEFLDIQTLAKFIKRFPLKILDIAPIDEAISTMGGISIDAINSNFELKTVKNTFCIGEMLDWNAPTGGYLIQACASSGVYLARELNNKFTSGDQK
jgi:uncharacterized flavoprotein (TIGR03862 family)